MLPHRCLTCHAPRVTTRGVESVLAHLEADGTFHVPCQKIYLYRYDANILSYEYGLFYDVGTANGARIVFLQPFADAFAVECMTTR